MIERASPLPPAPPEMLAEVVQLVVPLRFGKRRRRKGLSNKKLVLCHYSLRPEIAMIRNISLAAILAAALVVPTTSFAGVIVRFVSPENYSDSGLGDGTLAGLRSHLQRLGQRYLARGQTLTVDVLDVDRAGQYEPWRYNLTDVRILRDVTPPRIKLRYVLTDGGKRTRSGEETLSDINYQMNPAARSSSDRLVYEKALLDDWFRRNFANRSGGSRGRS